MGHRKKVVVKRAKAAKPLLPQGKVKKGKYYLRTEPPISPLDTEDGPLYMMKKKRRTSLHWIDAAIIVLEMLQFLALIQTMSLRWVWPKTWLSHTYFLFLFNVDVWEFVKVSSGALYGVQDYYTPSSQLAFSYNFIILAWGLLLLTLTGGCIVAYVILRRRKTPYFLIHVARIERAIIIIAQVLALPVGVVIAKLFQCTALYSQVDPLNQVTCFVDVHWAYITLSVLVIIGIYFIIPGWMIYRTHSELLAMNSQHHETYLQLKEMEYMSGLDVIWMVKGFHIFSSFKLRSAYFRPVMHFFKLSLLIVYAAGVNNIFAQAMSATVLLFILWLAIIILRPFRIISFNIMLILGYLCLLGGCIIGTCLASVPPSEVLSPWLVEPYSFYTIVGINSILFLGILTFIVHLLVYNFCCHRRKGLSPLWPSMANEGADKIGEETKTYMVAVLKARAVIEKCKSVNPLFAPVHELSHQIQIVNVYLREAEKLEDGLHPTLWDLLDEMIQVHEKVAPKSLFGDCVKDSIRETAEELMKLMPMFSRRLAQRDYDLILVSPLKRRMLLKMLAMGIVFTHSMTDTDLSKKSYFLNGRSEHVGKKQITGPEMTKMWPESESNPRVEDKIEYYEDLIPAPPQGPDQEQMYISESLTLPMQLVDINEDEQSVSSILQGAPEINLLSPTPSRPSSAVSRKSQFSVHGVDNLGYQDDQPAGSSVHPDTVVDTIVDLDGYTPGETNTDDLLDGNQSHHAVTEEEQEDNSETSHSQFHPVSTSSVPMTPSSRESPVRQKKLKKKKSTKRVSNMEDTGESTDH